MSVIKCRNCKVETENPEKGLCSVCRETATLHESIAKKLRTHIQNTEAAKAILENINELTELSKESEWQQCKQTIIDTMTSEKLNQKTAWRFHVVLQNIKGQRQHVQDWEKELIELLRNKLKYSLNTVAFILGRSKETVIRYSKEGDF